MNWTSLYIRTFSVSEYKKIYKHKFILWTYKEVQSFFDNLKLRFNQVLYVSNWYIKIDIDNSISYDLNDFKNNLIKKIKINNQETWKSWFEHIFRFLSEKQKELWIKGVYKYIDEITLDYDSWLSLFSDKSKLLETDNLNLLKISDQKYILDFFYQDIIKNKNKMMFKFLDKFDLFNYIIFIQNKYPFLTLEKIFITKILDWTNVINWQFTFKINTGFINKIYYETLFNKLSKNIFDKALKNASQFKLYKAWISTSRTFKFLWLDIKSPVLFYDFRFKKGNSKRILNFIWKKYFKDFEINNYNNQFLIKKFWQKNNSKWISFILEQYRNKQLYDNKEYILYQWINNFLWIIENIIPNVRKKINLRTKTELEISKIIKTFSNKETEIIVNFINQILEINNKHNISYSNILSNVNLNKIGQKQKINFIKEIVKEIERSKQKNKNYYNWLKQKLLKILEHHENYYKKIQRNKKFSNSFKKKLGKIIEQNKDNPRYFKKELNKLVRNYKYIIFLLNNSIHYKLKKRKENKNNKETYDLSINNKINLNIIDKLIDKNKNIFYKLSWFLYKLENKRKNNLEIYNLKNLKIIVNKKIATDYISEKAINQIMDDKRIQISNEILEKNFKINLNKDNLSKNKYKKIKLGMKKHDLITFFEQYLDKMNKEIDKIKKRQYKKWNFQDIIILTKKEQKILEILEDFKKEKQGKNIFYNISKINNFLRKRKEILTFIWWNNFKKTSNVSKWLFETIKWISDLWNMLEIKVINKELKNKKYKKFKEQNAKVLFKEKIKEFYKQNKKQSLSNFQEKDGQNYLEILENKIINKLKYNFSKNYTIWNRRNTLVYSFFYLKARKQYFEDKKNKLAINKINDIINNFEKLFNIDDYIEEHWFNNYYNIKSLAT